MTKKPGSIYEGLLTDGWGLDYSSSQAAAIEAGERQYTKSDGVTLRRQGRIGHVAPGETFTALTDAGGRVTGLPIAAATIHGLGTTYTGVYDYERETFVLLDNNRVVQFGPGDDVVDANWDPTYGGTGHGGHTSPSGTSKLGDILSYGEYVYWAWFDNTDGDIGRLLFDGSPGTPAASSNFFSGLSNWSTINKNFPVSMWLGPDEIIYVGNVTHGTNQPSTVGYYNPADGSNEQQALNVGGGWIVQDGTAYDLYSAIICNPIGNVYGSPSTLARGRVKVCFWDGFSDDPNFVYYIDDFKATKIMNDDGVLKVWTQGRNGTTKVWQFNGGTFVLLAESAQVGSAPLAGGADSFEGETVWGAPDGAGIYSLGPRGELGTRAVAHNGTAAATALGFVGTLGGSGLYAGATIGGTSYLLKINRSGYYPGGSLRTRLHSVPHRSTIKSITVFFSQFGSGASLTVSMFKDSASMSVGGADDRTNWVINATTEPTAATFMAAKLTRSIEDVSSFYLNFKFSHSSASDTAAVVRGWLVEYEASDKP